VPGLTFYSQYATAADSTVANIFNLRPTQPQLLTTSRTYETGIKHLFWNNRAEWTLSLFDIERRNVYVPESASCQRRGQGCLRASNLRAPSIHWAG